MNPNLTTEEIAKFRQQLVRRRSARRESVVRLTESAGAADTASLPVDAAEGATETAEQTRDLSLAELQSDELEMIDEALERIDEGGYGECVDCERPIAKERLEAVPWAACCLHCQALREAA